MLVYTTGQIIPHKCHCYLFKEVNLQKNRGSVKTYKVIHMLCKTLGQLTLRIKNSLMKSTNAKRHSECLVTKRSLMTMYSFEKSIQGGLSDVLTNAIQILFPVEIKGRYMFIRQGSTNLLSLFAFDCLTS